MLAPFINTEVVKTNTSLFYIFLAAPFMCIVTFLIAISADSLGRILFCNLVLILFGIMNSRSGVVIDLSGWGIIFLPFIF